MAPPALQHPIPEAAADQEGIPTDTRPSTEQGRRFDETPAPSIAAPNVPNSELFAQVNRIESSINQINLHLSILAANAAQQHASCGVSHEMQLDSAPKSLRIDVVCHSPSTS